MKKKKKIVGNKKKLKNILKKIFKILEQTQILLKLSLNCNVFQVLNPKTGFFFVNNSYMKIYIENVSIKKKKLNNLKNSWVITIICFDDTKFEL